MSKTREEIFDLMIEKLSGTIDGEDNVWLETMIAQYPQVKENWERLQRQYRENNIGERVAGPEKEQWLTAKDIAALRPVKQKRFAFSMAAVWITAILLVGAVAAFFVYSNHRARHAVAVNDLYGKAVLLKLGNGQVINLSNGTDSVYNGSGMRLDNNNKTLNYTASANAAATINTLSVPIGLDYKINLSDGSEVWLNSATVLSFPSRFSDSSRDITVNGEAYMKVAHDAAHPFIVHLPHGSVRVLGTEFNVNSYDSGVVKVALVEGSVNMQINDRKVKLSPGQEGVSAGKQMQVQPFDATTVLGWRQGIYYFHGATLQKITEVLPRWFGMQVHMDNWAKANVEFSGRVYRNAPITDFLDNLKATTSVDYYIQDSVVHFR